MTQTTTEVSSCVVYSTLVGEKTHHFSAWVDIYYDGTPADGSTLVLMPIDEDGETMSELRIPGPMLVSGRQMLRFQGTLELPRRVSFSRAAVEVIHSQWFQALQLHSDGMVIAPRPLSKKEKPATAAIGTTSTATSEPASSGASTPVQPVASPPRAASPAPSPGAPKTLDYETRFRLQQMFRSKDPGEIIEACRHAVAADWRTATTLMRSLYNHKDANVRRELAIATGLLAGYSLYPSLERMTRDADEGVREAAKEALLLMEQRHQKR